METVIRYIQLPLHFDAGAMLSEVQQLADVWLPHYNTNDYTGEWKAIPLRSINGSMVSAVVQQQGTAIFADTELMAQCPAIKAVVDSLPFEKTTMRILNLRPGAVIKEHIDQGLCYEEGEIRLHIPLVTNDEVSFYIDNEAVHPQPGECWYMNFNLPHRLANNGTTDRIHLVIDGVVNDWVHDLFASCDEGTVSRAEVPEKFSAEDKRQMIEQLKLMGTATAIQLADDMEKELATKHK